MLFDCSRTIVREALTRLAARGIVTVSARRGWYVIEPSQDEAREAFEARRVIETGPDPQRQHGIDKPAMQPAARRTSRARRPQCKGGDVGTRSFLLGDFHVCLAECLGNSLLADTLRDFTARTTLIAMLLPVDARRGAVVRRARADRRGAGARRPRAGRAADGRAPRHRAGGAARCRRRSRSAGAAARRAGAGATARPRRSLHTSVPQVARPRKPRRFPIRLLDLPRSPAMTPEQTPLRTRPGRRRHAGRRRRPHAQTALDDVLKAKEIKIAIPDRLPALRLRRHRPEAAGPGHRHGQLHRRQAGRQGRTGARDQRQPHRLPADPARPTW